MNLRKKNRILAGLQQRTKRKREIQSKRSLLIKRKGKRIEQIKLRSLTKTIITIGFKDNHFLIMK